MDALKKFSALFLVLIFVLSSCNLPTAQGGPPNLEATITAQALLLQQPGSGQPAAPGQPLDTPTSTLTPTITPTFTPTIPVVTVSQDTNCRSGPSKDYDYLAILHVGETATIIGKNTATNYWIVTIGGVTCWLWGEYATVSGNTTVLTEFAIPPTATPSLPAAPKDFQVHISCTFKAAPFIHNEVHIEMSWSDVATNEEGYKVYRGGSLLATLGANESSYSDDTSLPGIWLVGDPPPSLTYSVEAFNGAGKSKSKDKTVVCP